MIKKTLKIASILRRITHKANDKYGGMLGQTRQARDASGALTLRQTNKLIFFVEPFKIQ